MSLLLKQLEKKLNVILNQNKMRLSKCCDAEVKFGMVDDTVGHGMHEETECSNCGQLYPDVYDDEEEN